MKKTETELLLKRIKRNNYSVCLFGMGTFAKTGKYFINHFGISNYYYVDNDSSKWGTCPLEDGIECYSPNRLLENPQNTVVFIFTFYKYAEQIKKQVEKYNVAGIICEKDILQLDDVIKEIIEKEYDSSIVNSSKRKWTIMPEDYARVRNKSGNNYAVFTCVTGEYDTEVLFPKIWEEGVDYYYISDKRPDKLGDYIWIDINTLLPDGTELDNIRKNRFIKINGNYIFDEYYYSVYVDGNIQIKGNVKEIIPSVKSGYALFEHIDTPSLYAEGVKVLSLKYEKQEIITTQLKKYYDAGFPSEFGLFMNGVIIRENNNIIGKRVSDIWWREYYQGSRRDQLSFCYALWKAGCVFNDIRAIPGEYYDNNLFEPVGFHKKKIEA